MKKLIYLILVGMIVSINAQGITNTLGGNTSADKFIVENSDSDEGLVVTGEGNVGIGTNTPNESLDVDGTVQMTDFKLPTGASDGYILTSDAAGNGTWESPVNVPETKYLSIIGGAFLPHHNEHFQRSSSIFGRDMNSIYKFYFPVNLPNGVTITQLRASFKDIDAGEYKNITVSLFRNSVANAGVNKMVEIESSGGGNVFRTLWDDTVDYPTVDNLNYTYYLYAYWSVGASALAIEFYHVQIFYTE